MREWCREMEAQFLSAPRWTALLWLPEEKVGWEFCLRQGGVAEKTPGGKYVPERESLRDAEELE